MFKTIIYEVKGNVAWITLNRPDVLNAQNLQLRKELFKALGNARDDRKVYVKNDDTQKVDGELSITVVGDATIEAANVTIGNTATLVKIGTGANFCNDYTNCLFTGADHAIQKITKV